jgi:hypothetical protein
MDRDVRCPQARLAYLYFVKIRRSLHFYDFCFHSAEAQILRYGYLALRRKPEIVPMRQKMQQRDPHDLPTQGD